MFISLPYHVVNCAWVLRHFKQEISPTFLLESRSSRLTCHHQGLAGDSEYATQADWVIDSNLALAILAYSALYGRCHLVCVVPVQWCPGEWNFRQYCLIFNSIQMPICYVGCLVIANTWTYISIYIRNTAILENKICLYFSTSMCEHWWPSLSHLVIQAKCSHHPSRDTTDWLVWNIF